MFNPSGRGGHFETRDIPARTYEKTGMQIEIGEQITDIRRALAELSRKKKQLTRKKPKRRLRKTSKGKHRRKTPSLKRKPKPA